MVVVTTKAEECSAFVDWHSRDAVEELIVNDSSAQEIFSLSWGTGELVARGNMSEGARKFFEEFLKPMVDGYIVRRLAECPECA